MTEILKQTYKIKPKHANTWAMIVSSSVSGNLSLVLKDLGLFPEAGVYFVNTSMSIPTKSFKTIQPQSNILFRPQKSWVSTDRGSWYCPPSPCNYICNHCLTHKLSLYCQRQVVFRMSERSLRLLWGCLCVHKRQSRGWLTGCKLST